MGAADPSAKVAPSPIVRPFVPRGSMYVECSRCGNHEVVARAGYFRDADYYELLQEYFALERELRHVRARLQLQITHLTWDLESANFLIDHLQPLAMAQLKRLIDEAPE